METFFESGRGGFAVFCVLCLLLVPAQAGVEIGPNVLVEPGGVEVPLMVNVLGPEREGDVNEVREIIREANLIFQQANVQLSVARLQTGILIGDGDRRIAAAESGELLLGSLFELTGTYIPSGTDDEDATSDAHAMRHYGLRKGVKLNIADDIWVEEPGRVYLDWVVLPVAFLERAESPQETARNLVYWFSLGLGVPGSADPENLLYQGGTGTVLNSIQGGVINERLRPIGLVRSPVAEGLAPELLWGLHHGKNRGALFHSEGQGWIADFVNDVFYERDDESGFGVGDADLVYFKARTDSAETPIQQRYLTLKAVVYTTAFPENGGIDLYLSGLEPDDPSDVDPLDLYSNAQAIIGFDRDFAGVVNFEGDGLWNPLEGANVQATVVGTFTQLKAEIPFAGLKTALPGTLYQALANGGRVRFAAAAHLFGFDGVNSSFEDDITQTTSVFGPVPKPLPQIGPDAQITGAGGGSPGAWSWAAKAEQPFEVTRDNVHEFKRDFFSGAIPLVQQGTRTSEHVNYYDSSDNGGVFTSSNGFANETFAGIDDFAMSPGNPAGGDDDDDFGVQTITMVNLPAGLNILGVNISENMGFCLDVGGTTVGHSFRGLFPEDDNGANGFARPDDGTGVLTRHDYAFLVEQPGWYAVHLQALHTTGGASLELHQVLSSGTRLLGGDTANGGAPFEVPAQDVIDRTLAGGGTNGTSDQMLLDLEDLVFFTPPFRTFGDQPWSVRVIDDNRIAQSGAIADNQVTSLEATLDVGAGEIAFDYQVSSEDNFDFLRFSIDDVERQAWSGEEQGTASFPVEAGVRVFRWDFEKDGSASSGQDAAWIDNIAYPAP